MAEQTGFIGSAPEDTRPTGVLPINELLPFTHQVKRHLMDAEKLRYDDVATGRTLTLFDSAYRRLLDGEIALEDVYQ